MKLAMSGTMGSGKSAACGIFAEKGFAVFSADKFCANLLSENADVKNEVKSLIGSNAFDKNGVADKAYIAEKVFTDAALLGAYEAIFHKRFNAFMDSCNTGPSLFEVPLLFEKNDSQKRESQNNQKLLLKLYPVSLYSIHCILIDSIVTGYYPPRSFVCNITSNKCSNISKCL